MKMLAPVILAVFFVRGSSAQEAPSPYRGQEGREIKALSVEEIDSLRGGGRNGTRQGRRAEPSIPDRSHVLQLAEALELSEEQRAQTQEAFDRMKEEAVALGFAIVEKERALDRMFRDRVIDREKLEVAVHEIANLQGKLRLAHLEAHLELESVLTPDQIARYIELRGYHDPSQHHHPKKHH